VSCIAARALLEHVEVLLSDGGTQPLHRANDRRFGGVHVGTLHLRGEQRGAVVLRLDADVVAGRDLVRRSAEALAGDELLESLAVLRPELRRDVRQERTIGAAPLPARNAASVHRREVLRIVPLREADRLLEREHGDRPRRAGGPCGGSAGRRALRVCEGGDRGREDRGEESASHDGRNLHRQQRFIRSAAPPSERHV
jgi:hypothetical protein